MTNAALPHLDARGALNRYESVRHRLPTASFPPASVRAHDLLEVSDEADLFILDAYGVLNVGLSAIEGAAESVNTLVERGKHVMVLTNGATVLASEAHAKYRRMGFELQPWQVISSRGVTARALQGRSPDETWAVIAPQPPAAGEFAVRTLTVGAAAAPYSKADGIVFLSTGSWSDGHQAELYRALAERPRPLLVGNPDLVAPNEGGFSMEPGYYAHALADALGLEPEFFGKPYGNAFDAVFQRLAERGVPRPAPHRTLMVGDSLHTDVLGAAAAGVRSALVTRHGLLRGLDASAWIASTGITPDFILSTT